ncbi:MAG: hypothetical protein ACR2JU_10525 [Nocardioidaceae bacterium]
MFAQLLAHDLTADRSGLVSAVELDSLPNARSAKLNLEGVYGRGPGDQRNDVHQLISQLHVAVLKAHNRLVDRLRQDNTSEGELFGEAQRAALARAVHRAA